MDILIKEVQNAKNLYQIEVYDCNLNTTEVVEGYYFEDEKFAEEYGKARWGYENTGCFDFKRVVMKDGKEAPDGILYEDANYPGVVYVVPVELEKMFRKHMCEGGACLQKTNRHWFPKTYDFCIVSKSKEEYPPLNFDYEEGELEEEEQKRKYCSKLCGHCEVENDCNDCPYGISKHDNKEDEIANYAVEAAAEEI